MFSFFPQPTNNNTATQEQLNYLKEHAQMSLSKETVLKYRLNRVYDWSDRFETLFTQFREYEISDIEFQKQIEQLKSYWPKAIRAQAKLQPVILDTYLALINDEHRFTQFMALFYYRQLNNKFSYSHRVNTHDLAIINSFSLIQIDHMVKTFYKIIQAGLLSEQILFIYCSTPLNFYVSLDEVLEQLSNKSSIKIKSLWSRGIRLNVEILNNKNELYECKQLSCFKSILIRKLPNSIDIKPGDIVVVKIISYNKDACIFDGIFI